jgi:AcrR family transcriptional regulator
MNETGSVRPGGRTARTRAAVLDATLAELVDRGYEGMSVESVAGRAGVHKTTVYRRWGSKERLVAEALEAAAESRIGTPDTGDVEGDLRALARAVRATLSGREGAAAVYALVSGARVSPEVGRITRRFWATRMAHAGPIVERAVERGQLRQGTRTAEVIEYLAAPLYYRLLVRGEPPTEADADLAAAVALAAARAGVFAAD